MRLAWATDIHVNFLTPDEIDRFCDGVVATGADALVISGDISEAPSLEEHLRRLAARTSRPVYYVLGNHDFYHGSIAGVRELARELGNKREALVWLPAAEIVPLGADTALIGHDGWDDARLGNHADTPIFLNDFLLIEELAQLEHEQRLSMLRMLGDEAGDFLRRMVPAALARFRHVIVVIHVPPRRWRSPERARACAPRPPHHGSVRAHPWQGQHAHPAQSRCRDRRCRVWRAGDPARVRHPVGRDTEDQRFLRPPGHDPRPDHRPASCVSAHTMTYRDDLEAAKLRRNALARELREVRERMDELQVLGDRAHELERALDRCAADLDRARAKVPLPLLQQVRVASPCKERWDQMTGDDRVRFCGRCEKNVYGLSALTAAQAEALLRAHAESLCTRFYRQRDGIVMTSDCSVGRGRRRLRRIAVGALAAGVLAVGGGIAVSSSVCEPEPLMGAVAIQDPAVLEQGELIEAEELMGDVALGERAPPTREVRARRSRNFRREPIISPRLVHSPY